MAPTPLTFSLARYKDSIGTGTLIILFQHSCLYGLILVFLWGKKMSSIYPLLYTLFFSRDLTKR
jgi:hypothetical protein